MRQKVQKPSPMLTFELFKEAIKIKSVISVIVGVITTSFSLLSQQIGNFFESGLQLKYPFTIRLISNQDGLPQSEVLVIMPLKDRSLALSTALTPVIYNGYGIKRMLPPDKEESFYNRVWLQPKENKLWAISHRDGQLHCIYPNSIRYPSKFGPFLGLAISGDSILLSDVFGRITSFRPESGIFRQLQFENTDYTIRRLDNPKGVIVSADTLYMKGSTGVFAYHLKEKRTQKISNNFYDLIDKHPITGHIIGINSREIRDISRHDSLLRPLPLPNQKVMPLSSVFGSEGEYIIGTDKGLFFVYDDFSEVFDRASGLPSENIQSLYFDTIQTCLYAGTGEKGLLKLQYKTNYSFADAQNYSSGSSIVRLNSGETVFISGGKEIRKITSDSSLLYAKGHGVYSCLQAINGQLWAGTWGSGIKIYENKILVDSVIGKQLHNKQVLAILKNRNGLIWVGTIDGVSTGKTTRTITKRNDLKLKSEVVCLFELKDGTMCIGTTDGAYFVKDDKVVFSFDRHSGFVGLEVRCFYEDEKGRVWMGTYGHGIFVKEGNKVTSLRSKQNCMLDVDAFCLAEDDLGYFYSTSNHGLWRINKKSLFNFYENKIDYLVPFYYGPEEGILNTEFNGGFQNNYSRSPMRHFFFPNMEGVVLTVPEALPPFKLITSIESVTVNDTLVTTTGHSFDRNTNSLRFDFICSNLGQKNNIYFQHKLLGSSSDRWSQPQREHSVYLRLLPPGSYTFVVRAISGFNDPKPNEVMYAFTIAPFFYETIWFRSLVVLLLIGATALAVILRTRYQKNKEAEKERYSRKMAQLELKAIQAQLNPHFVFNCLNTIKSLILQRDFEKANQGLNTFSALTREMLESSDKIFIPFQQNLKFCKDYIELEKMRLQDQFTYNVIVDAGITENPPLPHLLIQPYIENAIKHGIAHLDGTVGYLEVEFSKTDKGILCRIRDNGIGREASLAINTKRNFHISKGTTLTVEKTSFLKTYIGYDSKITVLDLFDQHGQASGTEVTIFMPFTDESSSH